MVKSDSCGKSHKADQGVFGFFGLLGYIGAATYFISLTNGGFWEVIVALLQAIVWPAYAIYHLLLFLGV